MWIKNDTMYIHTPDYYDIKVTKVASFDLDWTLVKPAYGKFPKDQTDNVFMDNRVKVLKSYITSGYSIVIFTNQKITPRETLVKKLARMDDVINKLKSVDINVILFMSTEDNYRKPNTGMWVAMFKLLSGINLGFYCGDAAGRPGDFSDSDKQFAKNCNIQFYTPEEIFG